MALQLAPAAEVDVAQLAATAAVPAEGRPPEAVGRLLDEQRQSSSASVSPTYSSSAADESASIHVLGPAPSGLEHPPRNVHATDYDFLLREAGQRLEFVGLAETLDL